MEKEMEIFPNFILEKKQKSTIFEFIINPKNGQPILEHDKQTRTNEEIFSNIFNWYLHDTQFIKLAPQFQTCLIQLLHTQGELFPKLHINKILR